jgi:hypothetical protein
MMRDIHRRIEKLEAEREGTASRDQTIRKIWRELESRTENRY